MTTIFELLGTLKIQGASEFANQLKQVDSLGKTTSNNVDKYFSRIATVVAAAFSTTQIIRFTKSLVEASAQVSALNAQFSATFSEISTEANRMFDDVAKGTGVMTTRLRTAGTKAFSQFKGAGLDANRALSETERYLNLAADAAAYYDITLEDADMRLRSFIRGNVEAGDMIGLFTSETQRNSKALELYGQKYITLTEAQKQMTMLNIAEEIYSQSGAIGQASREADQYANVTGNLVENWLQFKAALGQPILEALIPVMQTLGSLMQNMVGWIQDNREEFDALVRVLTIVISTIGTYAATVATLSIIKTVTTWVKNWTTAQLLLNGAIKANPVGLFAAALAALVVTLGTTQTATDKLVDATDDLNKINENYNQTVDTLTDDTVELTDAERSLYEIRKQLLANEAYESVLKLADTYDEAAASVENLKRTFEINDAAKNAFSFVSDNLDNLSLVESRLKSIRDSITGTESDSEIVFISELQRALDLAKNGDLEKFGKQMEIVFEEANESSLNFNKELETLQSSIISIANAVNSGINIDFLIPNHKELYDEIMVTAEELAQAVDDGLNGGGGSKNSNAEDKIKNIIDEMNASIASAEEMSKAFSDIDLDSEKLDIYKSALQSLFDEGLKIEDSQVQDILAKIDELDIGLTGTAEDIAEVMSDLQTELDLANAFGNLLGDDYDVDAEKIRALTNAFGELFGLGLREGAEEIDYVISALDELNSKTGESVSEFDEAYAKMNADLSNAETMHNILGDSYDINAEKLRIYQSALETFVSLGLNESNEIIHELKENIDNLSDSTENATSSIKDLLNEVNTYFSQMSSSLMNIVDSSIDIWSNKLEAEISVLEEQYEEIKKLNDEAIKEAEEASESHQEKLAEDLYEGRISYKEYTDAIKQNEKNLANFKDQKAKEEEQRENELAAKKNEIERKQFEANKGTSIAQVWIDAASGIMKAYAQSGWILGSVQAALITAAAGVQTAAIASQQYVPALAEGGVVERATHALIGEDGPEAIVPLKNNTEWTRNVADALAPALGSGNDSALRQEVNTLRQMVAEFYSWVRGGNIQVIMDGQVVGRLVSPYVNAEFGNSSRLRARRI